MGQLCGVAGLQGTGANASHIGPLQLPQQVSVRMAAMGQMSAQEYSVLFQERQIQMADCISGARKKEICRLLRVGREHVRICTAHAQKLAAGRSIVIDSASCSSQSQPRAQDRTGQDRPIPLPLPSKDQPQKIRAFTLIIFTPHACCYWIGRLALLLAEIWQ